MWGGDRKSSAEKIIIPGQFSSKKTTARLMQLKQQDKEENIEEIL